MLADTRVVDWQALPRAFERRFLERWLATRAEASEPLRRFLGSTHEARIAEFRDLDREVIEYHRGTIAAGLKGRVQDRLRDPSLAEDLRFLRGQLARERGHRPVRELLQRAGGAVRAIKPCFLMSPMTVAQCLDPERHRFDLVVFDEASQVTPEDALGTVGRGTQVVVVGDSKQLPPTNFFAVQSGQIQATHSDGTFDDQDSVLELAQASGFARARLRWHYRSRHESLIAYSNRNFYDSSLFTFPSAELDRSIRGLQFEFVEDGVYEGGGVNRLEAGRVVEKILQHVRQNPTKSLCVGTFSLPQQLAVQDEIERLRRTEPALDEFLSLDKPEPFFVKNLESIQGDERDVVILSITYGPGPDGRVRLNFGPINGVNGWRRLNVLTTRARERMLVVSSMRADDIDAARVETQGARLLQAFLRFAESGDLGAGPLVEATAAAESPFESEVASALTRAGLHVQPQVGLAGYRIDLGIVDPEVPGRYVCGIECDGVAYHAAESARDRDRLRETVLRGLGWRLHRLWSVDWWHDPAGQTRRLLDLVARSKAEALRNPSEHGHDASPPVDQTGGLAREPQAITTRANSSSSGEGAVRFDPYRRATPHVGGGGLLTASATAVGKALQQVLAEEGPLHEDDLRARVLSAFGHARAGARIVERMDEGLRGLGTRAEMERAGPFWRVAGTPAAPRMRTGSGIPAERISGWEYEAAVVRVLSARSALTEDELTAVVRDGFGFGTASAALRDGIHRAVERLSAAGRVGIGGRGLALRRDAPASL